MKPLFDSEEFAFVGSKDGNLRIYCRRCDRQAKVALDSNKCSLHLACLDCRVEAEFTIIDSTPAITARGASKSHSIATKT